MTDSDLQDVERRDPVKGLLTADPASRTAVKSGQGLHFGAEVSHLRIQIWAPEL
jgi:hypothetical protein